MPANRLASAIAVASLAAGTLVACSSSAAACPTSGSGTASTPDWTYQGEPGSIEVKGPSDSSAPQITVEAPFSVPQTKVQTFTPAGDGGVVGDTATVSVCYMGVNGRTGKTFDSSFDRGKPAEFPVTGVIPGFRKALVGQKVGSTVGVAIAPADGYTSGQPDAGIQAGDTLIFAIKILSAK